MPFPTYQPPKPMQVRRARTMRRAMTEAEKRLWHALRRKLPGFHFRRPVAIGDFIVDFCCFDARLIVEVDGNQHGFARRQAHDIKRTAILEAQGFRVVRFPNEDVFRAIGSVTDTILAHLDGTVEN